MPDSQKGGIELPARVGQVLNRRAVAREWGVAPHEVDHAPHGEYLLALQLMEIEADIAQWKKRAGVKD